MEEHVAESSDSLQQQAHLAEYGALTNRITYWVSLQYVIYGFAAASLGFVAAAWGHLEIQYLAWVCMLILLFLLWALLQTNFEIFAIVVYLEGNLKSQLRTLLSGSPTWDYETFMHVLRKDKFIKFEQTLGLLPVFVVGMGSAGFLIVQDLRSNWQAHRASSGVWLACCLFVGAMTFLKWRAVVHLQKKADIIASEWLHRTGRPRWAGKQR
jgi:hypothetical protein